MTRKKRFPWYLLLLGLSAPLFSSVAVAENWPFWRGAQRDGISHETNIPRHWSETENTLWRLELPGSAGSTPIVWEDRIFLTSADESDLLLICASTDGEMLWKRIIAEGNEVVRDDEGNFASPSPSTDGEHVWCFMGQGELACFDFEGNEVWKFNVQQRIGEFDIAFGLTSTPVLDGDSLYLQLIHTGGARVVAINKRTSEVVWNVPRASDAHDECLHSYASPALYRDDEREFLLTHGADYIIAHRLEDGSEVWRCGGLHPLSRYDPTLRFVASPLAVPGMIVVPSAKMGRLVALKPDGQGDVTEQAGHQHWWFDTTPDVPSPLAVGELVYLCRENGNLICLDAASGEQLYEARCHRDRHRASPVYADGHIYLTARDGTITVVKHGREFEIVAQNNLGETMTSSPVISNGQLYLRTFDSLWAIGEEP